MTRTPTEFEQLKDRFSEKAWAHLLKARHERGEPINIAQQRCYRAALGLTQTPGAKAVQVNANAQGDAP
jgi:hypothetical protein